MFVLYKSAKRAIISITNNYVFGGRGETVRQKREETAAITFRLTRADIAAIDKVAEARDRTRSYIARLAVREFLEREAKR